MGIAYSGNVTKKPNGRDGWIMGVFTDNPLPYPFNDPRLEIKWFEAKKGLKREDPSMEQFKKTLAILIRGKHQINFPETGESVVLQKEGDYAFFDPGTPHTWEALEDNLTITLRWET